MCPELEDFVSQLNAADAAAAALLRSLTPRQCSWSPARNPWSVLQCLEHISVSVRNYLPSILRAIEKGRERGASSAGPHPYGRFEGWIIRTLEPPYKFKAKTAAPYQPAGTAQPADVLADFVRAHDELRDAIQRSDGLDLSGIRFRHPHAFFLVFSLVGSYGVLAGHARRHLWQARQVTLFPEFPPPDGG